MRVIHEIAIKSHFHTILVALGRCCKFKLTGFFSQGIPTVCKLGNCMLTTNAKEFLKKQIHFIPKITIFYYCFKIYQINCNLII